jgi:hypothetical protein
MQHSDRTDKRRLKLPFIILPLLCVEHSLSIIAAALHTRNISFTLRNHDAIIGNSILPEASGVTRGLSSKSAV